MTTTTDPLLMEIIKNEAVLDYTEHRTQKAFREWANNFHADHQRAYGFCNATDRVDIVNLRVTGVGTMPPYESVKIATGQKEPAPEVKGNSRDVYFEKLGKTVNCDVYDRGQLQNHNVITGPAIIEEIVSTTVLLPDYQARVDAYGNLIISYPVAIDNIIEPN